MPTVRCFFVALMLAAGLVAQSGVGPPPPKFFVGRPITVTEPKLEADGFFPLGPASICVEGAPLRQCYTAPEDFGRFPKVELVQLDKETPALLFSAASGGVSGWEIHYALLRPSSGKELENLFPYSLSVSNQSQNRFLDAPGISASPIFVTAEYVFGIDESHYGNHRFVISTYAIRYSLEQESYLYSLEDRFMTIRKYDVLADNDVIAAEKLEILARLNRVFAERPK